MPLFDFRCRACGQLFETLVRPNTGAPSCPNCKSADLEKQLTTFAVNSAERTRAAANAKRAQAASTGGRDNIVREAEMNAHRKEDH
jgi:putative FmdB family regulatory protein